MAKLSARRGPWITRMAIASATAVLLAACGSANSSDEGTAADLTNPDAQAAAKLVEAASAPVETVDEPGPALTDPVDLTGKTVMYIPIGLKVAYFQTQGTGMTEAIEAMGGKVISCDGEFTPSGVAKCIDQGIGAKVDAVLTSAVPVQMASTSFARLTQAGIPTLLYAAVEPDDAPEGLSFKDATAAQHAAAELSAQAVIADSDGEANVLYVKIIDSPSLEAMGDKAIATFKEQCSKCKVTVKELNSANLTTQLPGIVSGALLKDGEINYVMPQTDALMATSITGVQNANATNRVKFSTTAGSLGGLQLVKSNPKVIADVGYSAHFMGWASADTLVRVMSGADVPEEYQSMVRVFNQDNINDLDLTPAAEKTNDWYGSSDYKTLFPKLWGQG